MRLLIATIVASVVVSQPAFAVEQCSKIEESARRLTCYDAERNGSVDKDEQAQASADKLAKFVQTAKSRTTDLLTDPESARFTKLYVVTSSSTGSQTLCGFVNSKNKLGGYTGPQYFMSAEEKKETIVYGLATGFDGYINIMRIKGVCKRENPNVTIANIE
jgi:hypothetical protein